MPVVFMGDELALRNDHGYVDVPEHAADNRWAHRPVFPDDVARRRHEPGTLEHRTFTGLAHLARVRGSLVAMHGAVPAEHPDAPTPEVHVVVRPHPGSPLVALYNVTAGGRSMPSELVRNLLGGAGSAWEHLRATDVHLGGDIHLPPYAAWWLTALDR